ncbi:MAG: redoxin domain-containing protein [Pirellulaceae bacterium]|nr:redoxin domain-containing protein [Pirellulaceae bacterium]
MNRMLRDMFLGLFVALALSTNFSRLAANESTELTKALSFKPRQADVNYEKVSADEVGKCKLEKVARDDGKGFWVTGPAGQPLRWFVDTNGDNKPDRWCYFNAGDEVYRESDTNFNGTADEYRWLNTEGMRWGIDSDEDGTIDSWRIISAEEISYEVIQALATGDIKRFQRLLPTEAQIEGLALGSAMTDSLKARVQTARDQFPGWMRQQQLVTATSRWTNFGADKPGIVPAGTAASKQDIVVYENAVALFDNDGEARQLIIGTLIQVDGSWRLASLPRKVGDNATSEDTGVFFNVSYNPRGQNSTAETEMGISKSLEALVVELQGIDDKLNGDVNDKASLHARRADVLDKLIASAQSADDRAIWIEQMADTVSAAAQIGEYPDGTNRLRKFSAKLKENGADASSLAYVEFRRITAEHNLDMQQPGAKFEELNEAYLASLRGFIEEYPQAEDSAEAILQIALAAEFNGDAKEAARWYDRAAKGYASSDSGKKAAGALRRLNLEGKPFSIAGTTLDGKTFNSNAFRDRPVVYHCWASWCEGCKADMRALKELQAKYAKHKLLIVGVNLDKERAQADQFIKQNPYPWPHIHDPGGLDSSLATSYGILTLPVNIVVDKNGNVVKSGAHWTELDRIIDQLVKPPVK